MTTFATRTRRPLRALGVALFAAAAALGPSVAAAQAESAPAVASGAVAAMVPGGTGVSLYIDCAAVVQNRTFLRLMDIVEASEGYRAAAEKIASWGFEPRSDLREVIVVFGSLTGTPEFAAVAVGDIDPEAMQVQLDGRSRLTRTEDDLGILFQEGRLGYEVRDGVAVAGTEPLLRQARELSRNPGVAPAVAPTGTLWLHVRPTPEERAQNPALAAVEEMTFSLVLDDTPELTVSAKMTTAEAAAAGAAELTQAFRTLSVVPEVVAFGFGPLLTSAAASADGSVVNLRAEVDAASWARFSDMLEELVREELR